MKIVWSKYENIINFGIHKLTEREKSVFNNYLGAKTDKELELKIPPVIIDHSSKIYTKSTTIDDISELYSITIDDISDLYFIIVSLTQNLYETPPWKDRFSDDFRHFDISHIKYLSKKKDGIGVVKAILDVYEKLL